MIDYRSAGLSLNDQRLAQNNFDLLRFLFAGIVCVVHASRFSGYKDLAVIGQILESAVAVKAFFVLSGFLIFMSYERSSSMLSYVRKRFRRIYPAYATIILLCAFGFVFISTKNAADYFSFSWLKYVLSNLVFLNFLQPTLPGVFESNFSKVVDGSLWTLKIEVMFYLSVPFFVYLFRRFSPLPIIVLVYCLSLIYSTLFWEAAKHAHSMLYYELSKQLPGQLTYFMAGAFFYYYFSFFERFLAYFAGVAILILFGSIFLVLNALEPFALATIVIFFGMFFYAGNFGKYGDFSYGLYIIHFPILQILVSYGWFRESQWIFLSVLFVSSLIGSMLMWHFVEKPFLLRKSHYVAVNRSGSA